MKKTVGITAAILMLAAITVVVLSRGASSSASPTTASVSGSNGGNAQTSSPSTGSTSQKLSDTQYANYAYLISGDNLDSSAKAALAGFSLNKQANPDGTTTYTLAAQRSSYHNQSFTLKPGEKLYFIETSMGDDFGSQDTELGDDTGVAVDANGYILNTN